MKVFTKDELSALAMARKDPSVSIYMPRLRPMTGVRQDSLRLKHLLQEAEEKLVARGMDPSISKAFLEPAEKMLSDIFFWKGQHDGLAIFLNSENSYFYQVPLEVPELVVVSQNFHLKPLLGLISTDVFYILVLGQNEVRLLHASKYSVSEVNLEGLELKFSELLKTPYPGKPRQFFDGSPKITERQSPNSQAHDQEILASNPHLQHFCQKIDQVLQNIIRNEQAPLVVAGLDDLMPIFLQKSSYPYLLPEGLAVNTEIMSPEDLQRQAWPIVAPFLDQARREAEVKYQKMDGTEKTSYDFKDIVPAAYHGKVECLFVAAGRQEWGIYDAERNELHYSPESKPGAEDLLDAAAIQTMIKGGKVFSVAHEAIPDGSLIAAIFR